MKRFLHVALAACLMMTLTGCTVEKAQSSQSAPGAPSAQATDVAQASDASQATDVAQASDASQATGASQALSSESGAQAVSVSSSDVIELTEKMYVTYINEIYTNFDDYIGRTIKLQGMFSSEYYEPTQTTYDYVYRVGPGCCGNDGSMCGFEFTWNGEMPEENDWIEVTGVLDKYDLDGQTYLTLKAQSVTEMSERGEENVYR